MRILTSPLSSNVIFEDCREFCSSRGVFLHRPGIFCLASKKPVNLKLLHFVSAQQQILKPVRSSSFSDGSQVDLGTAESQALQTNPSKTVHVRFLLQKECLFGEHFFIVGEDPIFGLWDPENAIPLNWSDRHVWTLDLDMPVGKSTEFKILLKGKAGKILWQPGLNRVLKTWETNNTITVVEDWESAELQRVCEEELVLVNQEVPQPSINSASIMVAESTNNESSIGESNTDREKKPSLGVFKEKPLAIVADNINFPWEDSQVDLSSNFLGEKEIKNSGESTVYLDKSVMIENTTSHEGAPVLVPGLTPISMEETDEVAGDNNEEEASGTNASAVGAGEAKSYGSSELDEKQDAEDETQNQEKLIDGIEQRHHQLAEEEMQHHDPKPLENKVLENDIQWGRRALQKLLNGFGLL